MITALDGGGGASAGTITLVGADASKPSAAVAGRLYFANDTGTLYRDTGSAWVAVVPLQGAGLAPTAAGSFGYDTTKQALVAGGGGSAIAGVLSRLIAAPACAPGSTDSLDASGGTGVQVFGTGVSIASGWWIVGKRLRIVISLGVTSTGSPPTLALGVRVQKAGPTNVDLYTHTPTGMNTSITRVIAPMFLCEVLSVSASGTMECALVGAGFNANSGGITSMPVTFDMTATQTLQFTATFGTATAGNIVKLRSVSVEELN